MQKLNDNKVKVFFRVHVHRLRSAILTFCVTKHVAEKLNTREKSPARVANFRQPEFRLMSAN